MARQHRLVVPYELYQLYDWGKVPELYVTLQWTWNFMELYEFYVLGYSLFNAGQSIVVVV